MKNQYSRKVMSRIFLLSIFLSMVLTLSSYSQSQEEVKAVTDYVKALEKLEFETAYNLLAPEEKAVISLADFKERMPVQIIKGLRLLDSKYFTYFIAAENKGETVTVTTFNIDKNYRQTMIFLAIPCFAELKVETINEIKPEDVRDVFKKQLGDKALPIREFKEEYNAKNVNGKFVVIAGYAAAEEKAKKEEAKQKARKILSDARNNKDYTKCVAELEKYKDILADSKYIKEKLPLLKKMADGVSKVIITIGEITSNPGGTMAPLNLFNGSELTVSQINLEYTLYDKDGKEVIKQQSLYMTAKFCHPRPDVEGAPAGYKGVYKLGLSSEKNWVKADIKITRVIFLEEFTLNDE